MEVTPMTRWIGTYTVPLSGAQKRRLRTMFGMTPEEFHDLYRSQDGKCAGCRRLLLTRDECHIDHDYETRAVRGILCGVCNRSLPRGMTPETLERLATYLRDAANSGGNWAATYPLNGRKLA